MSLFICADCDEMRDADDGCEEAHGFRLRCVDCIAERKAEAEEAADLRRANPLEPDFKRWPK